ncbi:MAG: putative lipid kinase [Pelotomaculum sp. PtaB.Bin013]|uniref:DAGKc domain-containing protein n=1 Tax=Pelotomaculum isophthalicicum JI TaxID=947010 RepID=A0A9X4H211_9FIRM|nr:hypothetical protein [Pelotomaculum isophthalicicum]MDF9407996.1 hypothetical protein [Pelotomaculum isophthalicicum JI]OPX81639.1 MAG: putative lipid kinase [Pelotomaculum sp. PtaB.Bin013]
MQQIDEDEFNGSYNHERSAVLIVNTHSRRGQQFFLSAKDELTKQGISIVASYPVRYPERLPEVVQDAIKHKHKLIVVGGGGTGQ